jgi:hypothetical protein
VEICYGQNFALRDFTSMSQEAAISQHKTRSRELYTLHRPVLYGDISVKRNYLLCGDGFVDVIHRPKSKILKTKS